MDLHNIKNIAFANPGATSQELTLLKNTFGSDVPTELEALLSRANGLGLQNGIVIYACHEVAERNATYQVDKYIPGFIAIGDDSGGRAILLSQFQPQVFLADYGSLDVDEIQAIANTLREWVEGGCPL